MESSLLSKHHVDTLVLSCVDFRFSSRPSSRTLPALHDVLDRALGIYEFDPLLIPGGVKVLSAPESAVETSIILHWMHFLVGAHRITQIVLINHQHCGKYAASGHTFANADEERMFHGVELRKAAAIVRKEYPSTAVKMGYLCVESGNSPALHMVSV